MTVLIATSFIRSLDRPTGQEHRLSRALVESRFTQGVVDEAQDISAPELHLLNAMAGGRAKGISQAVRLSIRR